MSNIEKLLQMLVARGGERIVVREGRPAIFEAGDQRRELSKKPLGQREVGMLINEWDVASTGKSVAIFGGVEVVLEKCSDGFTLHRGPRAHAAPEAEVSVGEDGARAASTSSAPATDVTAVDLPALLDRMLEVNASDLHLSTGCRPMMRVDGDMNILKELPEVSETRLLDDLRALTPESSMKEFMEEGDTDFSFELPGKARFRANIFRDHRGVGAVFRQIPAHVVPVEELGVPEAVVALCERPKGLMLVTGPTGSGKSTTLAALVDHINDRFPRHIITIEDPIEFVHENRRSLINQREVHTHTGSFKKALRAALREDPDVILVGEMRDLETIAIAVEMAVTGHLVLGTLHTTSAVGTVDRIVDQFPSDQQSQIRVMLADALIGVVSQTLCKKVGGGRLAAFEVMVVTRSVSNLIREGKMFQIPSLMQTGKAMGMQLLNGSLVALVEGGLIETDEALARTTDRGELTKMLGR